MEKTLSYRFAEELLGSGQFAGLQRDIVEIVQNTDVPVLTTPKERSRQGRTLVTATQRFAASIDENVVYFERVVRELPYAKMSITLPIWVIGVDA